MTLSFKSFLTQFLRINVKKNQQDSFLLTLTIVDTNRRTRAATCRRMIPSSRSSIFTDDLDSNEKRRECLSACVCVCVCVWMSAWWDMGVSLQQIRGFRETSSGPVSVHDYTGITPHLK